MLARKSGNIINMASVASSIKGKYYIMLQPICILMLNYKLTAVINHVVYRVLAICS